MGLIEINWQPGCRELRQFGALWLSCSGLLGVVVAWRTDVWSSPGWHPGWLAPVAIWTGATLVGLLGLVTPRTVKPVYVAWMALALPLGWVVAHLMLATVFYLILTPVGLVFRAAGRDPLQRKFAADAASYWARRSPVAGVKRYLRQF